MKIYVINLPKDKERRKFQKAQLEMLGLEYEILNAISVEDIQPSVYAQHKDDWQRPLRNVEVACYYSHRALWQKIIEVDEPALILEDDALMSKCVPDILNSLAAVQNIDYATLEVRGRKKLVADEGIEILPNCKSKMYRLYLDRTGAAGYVLFPSGAKKLLDREAKSGIGLADAHITACYELIGYQVEPAPLIQLDQCEYYAILSPIEVKSNISSKNKPEMLLATKVFFKLKRIKAQISQAIQQIRHMFRATRKDIKIEPRDFEIEK